MGKNTISVGFEVQGLKPLLDRLDLVKRSTRNVHLRAGLRKAARRVASAAKAKLKEEGVGITGELKKSINIKVSVKEGSKRLYGIIGPDKRIVQIGTRKRDGKKSKAGDTITHIPSKIAHLVEYGHGGPHPAPAHPFMRPAWEGSKEGATKDIADELTKGIVKAARQGK